MCRTVITAVLLAFLMGPTSEAHHSGSGFTNSTVTLDGTIERIAIANPHTVITIRTTDHVHTVFWNAASQLNEERVDARALKVGDRIVVTGSPAVNPFLRQLSRVSLVRRPKDGWQWGTSARR